MGLTMRDDPPKVVDVANREWGMPRAGFALSIQQVPREDPSALPALSVALRNVSAEPKRFTVPGWLFFYRIEITGLDGTPVPMSPFGRQLLKPERNTERVDVSLAPGEATEAVIPIGSIFSMSAKGSYSVIAACEPPSGGGRLESNRITVVV
jgi:hypothetical protein